MAKKKTPTRKFDTPNRYFKKSGERCSIIKISFTVTTKHIMLAIHELLEYDGTESDDKDYKITPKNVERRLRSILHSQGEDSIERLEYDERTLESDKWKICEEWARKLYPKWFENYHGNALRTIMGDE